MITPPTRRLARLAVAALLAVGIVVPVVSSTAVPDAAAVASIFTPITPVRALDTREPGDTGPKVGPGSTITLDLSAIVPAGATAVSLNVTAVDPTAATFLTVWPAGAPKPWTSNMNVVAKQVRPNAVIVGLGEGRKVSIFNNTGSVHVVVDVMGYTTAGFTGITPVRLLDTREPNDTGLPLGGGATRQVPVAGVAGVPSSASAVVLNVTAVSPTASGYLTVWPAGGPKPATSNLNFVAGDVVPNLVTVGVGTGGEVSIFNFAGSTHVVVDIMGWFDNAGGFAPLGTPSRLLDTREGTCGYTLGPGETRTLQVTTSASVSAVTLNVTAVSPTAGSYITVWPAGSPRPGTSNVNVVAGQAPTPNLVTVGVGPAGEVNLFNFAGTVELVVDLFGTFAGTTPPGTPTPCPLLSPGGGTALVAELALQRSVGVDRIAVWVCRVPAGTTNASYLSFGSQRLTVTPASAATFATDTVAPYFATVSRGRYATVFEPQGYIDLAVSDGPGECLDQAENLTTANGAGQTFTNVLAVDTSTYMGGFAGPGLVWFTPGLTGRHLVDPPSVTGRGAWVGGGVVARLPDQAVIAHELGHTLHWPHSYIGPTDEYDNPVDLMSGWPNGALCLYSGSIYPCKPQETIAFNRLTSGWIDDSETAVHTSGTSTVQLAAPQQAGVQILLAKDPDSPGVVLTLEARPQVGYDSVLDSAGVAVHIVDQSARQCTQRVGSACVSLWRRQGQALGAPDSAQHVIGVGGAATVSGLTITVVRPVGTGYLVTVSGTFDADANVLASEVYAERIPPGPPPTVGEVVMAAAR
jgi:hypothetical protein